MSAQTSASVLRMYLADREGVPGTVASLAALAEGGRVRQGVRGGGEVHVTACASRSNRRNRIDRTLRIHHLILARRQDLLATVDMAHRAVAPVARIPLWAESGKTDPGEVIVAPAETHNYVTPIVCLEIHTGVDSMRQEVEVDALRRQRFIRRKLGASARGCI